jgi:DNA-binding response OmpR family regulator
MSTEIVHVNNLRRTLVGCGIRADLLQSGYKDNTPTPTQNGVMIPSRRVLMIVEDDPASRGSLGSIFSRRGWAVCAAGTLSEAMAFLDHGLDPDCLVLDLTLPDGNGEEVLRRVRRDGLKTRVAVCTGTQDQETLTSVRSLAPNGLLAKPIDLGELEKVCEAGRDPAR